MESPGVALIAGLLVLAGCGSAAGLGEGGGLPGTTVAANFASPPQYPGHAWQRNGHEVPPFEVVAAAGPEHCGWQSATVLTLGLPLGTEPETAAQPRRYIRDPNGRASEGLH